MMQRIDLFMPPISRYNALHHMTKDIFQAFKRLGVNCRLLVAQKDNPQPFLESIFSDKPDFTFSLNGLLPDEQGRFFCDMIKIPHVGFLVDSPNHFVTMAKSAMNIITCPDVFSCHFLRGLHCENVLFLPHGVAADLAPDPKLQRTYDVVFLASCIDYKAIEEKWKTAYPKPIQDILFHAAEIALSPEAPPYVQAFVAAMNDSVSKHAELDPAAINMIELLDELEVYIRGKDRVELVRAIRDADVLVIGAGGGESGWEKYLSDRKNVTIRPPIPFEEALEVMKQSKIILNSCAWINAGGHERLFAGMACEALVITDQNPWLKEKFTEGQELAFYRHGKWDEVNAMINGYLADEPKRRETAQKGRDKVMKEHTWDVRMKSLLQQIAPILEKLKALA